MSVTNRERFFHVTRHCTRLFSHRLDDRCGSFSPQEIDPIAHSNGQIIEPVECLSDFPRRKQQDFMYKHLLYPILLACLLPLIYQVLPVTVKRKICPLLLCTCPVLQCVREPECKVMLDCTEECDDANSDRRKASLSKYEHLQFPHDSALCVYECLGLITTQAAEDMVECVGDRGCLQPAQFSDTCADVSQKDVLPLSVIPNHVLEGRWRKVYTNSWDLWSNQVTEFFPPGASAPEPRSWMTAWPHQEGVWRMDLSWSFQPGEDARRFNMSSELFPGNRWEYPGGTEAYPTLRTVAHMW